MTRALIVSLALVASLAFAGVAGGASDGSRGLQRIPRISYASMLKNPHADARQRFKLRLFTRETHHRRDVVSASLKRKRSVAAYYGPNRSFDEWRVTRRKRDGRLLLHKLVNRIRDKGHVAFAAYLLRSGASSPAAYRCKVRDYGSLGSCRSIIIAQRG